MSNQNDFIEVELKDEWKIKVRNFVNDNLNFVCNTTNTEIKSDQDYIGFLGQSSVGITINGMTIDDTLTSKPNGDEGIDITINGVKYDVKTRGCNYYPQSNYSVLVKVTDIENHPLTDGFIFVAFMRDESKVIITGYITKEKFLQVARLRKQGEYSEVGFQFKVDNYECHISDLNNTKELLLKPKDSE